jgi:MYXO-CTERM domain-containing protein
MMKTIGRFSVVLVLAALGLGWTLPAFAEEDDPDGAQLSMAQTSYIGARLLKGQENVKFESITMGQYSDAANERYAYWQGDTLFAGVKNTKTGNKVDMVAEWYWFESSIPRNADFYVGVVKVKASPNPVQDWYMMKQGEFIYDLIYKQDMAHYLEFKMDPSGAFGGLRWDWCVPFDSYKWDPKKTIEVESGYSAGFDVEGGFSEGGILKDLTDKSNIEAKGYMSAKHSVSTKYTITLYAWQMLVSSGGDNIRWQLFVLPEGNSDDSAYHEYFVVVQATKGHPVVIPELNFGGNFRQWLWYWFDNYDGQSATIKNLSFNPPPTCYVDDDVPADVCPTKGVCGNGQGFCDVSNGAWSCNYPDEYEKDEVTCDGLDNDCDGKVDEKFSKLGQACDGSDEDGAKNGVYVCNGDGTNVDCDEDPCAGKQCGDGCGDCQAGFLCKQNKCVSINEQGGPDDPEKPTEPLYDCDGVTEVGQCDGNWLLYCAGGELVELYCNACCAWDDNLSYYNCMAETECGPKTCIPSCGGKECGQDGCGGSCGTCGDGETCDLDGQCAEAIDKTTTCGTCPLGWICGANGQCVQGTGATSRPEDEAADDGEASSSCSAGRGPAQPVAALLAALLGLALVVARRVRRSSASRV